MRERCLGRESGPGRSAVRGGRGQTGRTSWATVAGTAAVAVLAGLTAPAASAADAAGASPQARATINVDGTVLPNFDGIWVRRGSFLFPGNTRDPLKEEPPYKPELMKAYDAYRHKMVSTGIVTLDPTARCLPPGVPRMMNAVYPMEILLTPGQVTIIEEWMNETRRVYTDGRKHEEDPDITYVGDSIGNWEKGGTLVIDTVALQADTLLDQSGLTHSKDMHVVERMRLLGPTVLENQITVDDPVVFTHPWVITRTYDRAKPTETIHEFVCEQNNRNPIDASGAVGTILEGDSQKNAATGAGQAHQF